MFKKIALVGGPCSGKTTALAYISERLWDFSHRALLSPEVATQLITGGIPDINNIQKTNPALYLEIESTMFFMMRYYERYLEKLAGYFPAEENIVILCDRGRMDVKAYIDPAGFVNILDRAGCVSEQEICADYDAVIHLVTAAKGAEEHYTLQNNKARRESALADARMMDTLVLDVWKDHPHLTVIDNYHSTSFEHKMRRTLQAVLNVLGIPQPVEYERKFLLYHAPDPNISQFIGTQTSVIEQIYLASDVERRVRNRRYGDFNLYYETHKRPVGAGARVEVERRISADEYAHLSKEQKPGTRIIRKTRRCFIYKDRRFELDVFLDPIGLAVLEIELADMSEKVELPPFLEIMQEVTDDPRYTNYALSQKY